VNQTKTREGLEQLLDESNRRIDNARIEELRRQYFRRENVD
jgi:hypothetical protein